MKDRRDPDAHDLTPRHFGAIVLHLRRKLIDSFTDHSQMMQQRRQMMQQRRLQNFIREKRILGRSGDCPASTISGDDRLNLPGGFQDVLKG